MGVLESARGKRKSEVEEIVAGLSPRPDVPPSVRKVPAPKLAPPAVALLAASLPGALRNQWPRLRPRCSAEATPLSPNRYKLQLTIGGDTLEKLKLAKDLLRHAIPSGDDAAILDRALTALLADLARKKCAATDHPRPPRGTAPGSRHIPAEVKRAVWLRDIGRCAFVGTNQRRCGEKAFLEFHHVQPYAAGGGATVENVELRCRRHNDFEARTYFGQGRSNGLGEFECAGAARRLSGPSPSTTRSGTSSISGALP